MEARLESCKLMLSCTSMLARKFNRNPEESKPPPSPATTPPATTNGNQGLMLFCAIEFTSDFTKNPRTIKKKNEV